MNVLRSGIVTMLLLAAFCVQAACTWPAWEQFKKDYISQEGRVIDPSDARKITTSEGQSYGMFFALAANDRAAFDNILDWTQNNLAQGSLKERLPALTSSAILSMMASTVVVGGICVISSIFSPGTILYRARTLMLPRPFS